MALSTVPTFPSSLDAFPLVQPGDTLATNDEEHDLLHNLIVNTIAQIEQKLGIDGAVSSQSIDYIAKHHQHQGSDNSAQLSRLPIRMTASQSLNPIEVSDSGAVVRSAITPAGEFLDIGQTASSLAVRSYVSGDTQDRWQVQADGTIKWGAGGASAPDVTLSRTLAGRLTVSGTLQVLPDPASTGNVSLVVQATSGQTANLFALRDSSGANLVQMSVAGAITTTYRAAIGQTSTTSQQLAVIADSTTTIGQINKRFSAASTADLFRATSETNAVLMSVSATGLITGTAGLDISGSPTGGYPGGEIKFSTTTANSNQGFSTFSTGSPRMLFDHRATANTGDWYWRNGTGGGVPVMGLSATGALTLGIGGSSGNGISINAGSVSGRVLYQDTSYVYMGAVDAARDVMLRGQGIDHTLFTTGGGATDIRMQQTGQNQGIWMNYPYRGFQGMAAGEVRLTNSVGANPHPWVDIWKSDGAPSNPGVRFDLSAMTFNAPISSVAMHIGGAVGATDGGRAVQSTGLTPGAYKFRDNDNHFWEGDGLGGWIFRNTWNSANAIFRFMGGSGAPEILRVDDAGGGAGFTNIQAYANGIGAARFKFGTALGAAANGVPTGGRILYI